MFPDRAFASRSLFSLHLLGPATPYHATHPAHPRIFTTAGTKHDGPVGYIYLSLLRPLHLLATWCHRRIFPSSFLQLEAGKRTSTNSAPTMGNRTRVRRGGAEREKARESARGGHGAHAPGQQRRPPLRPLCSPNDRPSPSLPKLASPSPHTHHTIPPFPQPAHSTFMDPGDHIAAALRWRRLGPRRRSK